MTATVDQEMAAVRSSFWRRRYHRVDQCLLRGGDWYVLDLMRCTGLGSGAVYVRLAQLEAAGFVTSMRCADGRRQYAMVDEILIRHRKQRFHAAMNGAPSDMARIVVHEEWCPSLGPGIPCKCRDADARSRWRLHVDGSSS